jgi:hypothetical protein
MGMALDYRLLATDQRRKADEARLPLVRLKHLGAAEKFECLAQEVERFEHMPTPASHQDIFF